MPDPSAQEIMAVVSTGNGGFDRLSCQSGPKHQKVRHIMAWVRHIPDLST